MKLLKEIKNWHYAKGELNIAAADQTIQIHKINEGVFRVRLIDNGTLFAPSLYAVPNPPIGQDFEVIEQADKLEITTDMLRVAIAKNPIRLSFHTPEGQLISQDDPGLGIITDGSETTNYRTLQPGERFFGLGEKTGPLDRAGKQYRNWNTDAYSYGAETDPLYVSCPFFMGLAHGHVYGIFLNNTSETVFNFGAANDRFSFFQAKTGSFEYYFFSGADPAAVLYEYTALTGRTPLPPIWSLGYQQCRYSYHSADEVIRIAKTFRQKQIPADVIYLDIHYMQDYKVFTWQDAHFKEPGKMIATLREMGFRVVPILDPGIKVEADYDVFETGVAEDVFLKYPDGGLYSGGAWPGWCHFPDYTKPAARTWWKRWMKNLTTLGISGFWNDMNEPAAWGHHTPNILAFDNDGKGGDHKLLRNIYGMEMSRTTREGAEESLTDERIFVLTRAGFSGSQRYAAVWTGDNYASDEHLMLGCRLLNSMGLSGFAFTGNDVGGFIGDASPALYMRWIAVSAFQGMMRGHSMINSRDAEPWTFGEEAEQVARNFINLRYALLPTLYSLFYEASQSGMPITRSLAFYYFQDWKVFQSSFDNQFLFGRDLLVCPVPSTERFTKVYLPKGRWYNFWNDELLEGPGEFLQEVPSDQIPVFARAGGLLVTEDPRQHTAASKSGRLALHAYLGGTGNFRYYTDDGSGLKYQEGAFTLWDIEIDLQSLRIKSGGQNFDSGAGNLRIYLHGFRGETIKIDGKNAKVAHEKFRFLEKIPNFDPFEPYPDFSKDIENLAFIDVSEGFREMLIEF